MLNIKSDDQTGDDVLTPRTQYTRVNICMICFHVHLKIG